MRNRYCTGCGVTFDKTHKLMNHRRSHKCGGRYLPVKERGFLDKLRLEREAQDRKARELANKAKQILRHGAVR